MAAAKDLPGDAALLTITGPGNDYFRPKGSLHQVRHRARKRLWNASAPERWQALHRRASRLPREMARYHGSDWGVLYRTWEWQKRGVKHVHLVLPYGTKVERAATGQYCRELFLLARDYGFGFVLGGDRDDEPGWERPPKVKAMSVNAVAAYVSKYVSKAGSERDGMVSMARAQGMRGSVLYIAPRLLRESGISMTTLRNRRRIATRYPWANTSQREWENARVVDAVQQGVAPLTQEAVEAIREQASMGGTAYVIDHVTGRCVTPTKAPAPPGLRGHEPRTVEGRAVVHVGLASVLLRVPEPEELGWFRTAVEGIGRTLI